MIKEIKDILQLGKDLKLRNGSKILEHIFYGLPSRWLVISRVNLTQISWDIHSVFSSAITTSEHSRQRWPQSRSGAGTGFRNILRHSDFLVALEAGLNQDCNMIFYDV